MRTSSWGLAWVVLLSAGSLLADEPTATAGGPVEPPFIVKGRVVDVGDRPVAGALIYNNHNKSLNAVTGDDGRFVLELPRKPPQFLSLCATIEGEALQAFVSYRVDGGEELLAEIKLVLRPAREIDVAVVDAQGQPVQDAKVNVNGKFYIAKAKTDASGKVIIRVPVDTELAAVSAGKSGTGFDYFRYESPKAPESDSYKLPHDHALPLKLVLNGCRQVTVRVIDDRGLPIAGVLVRPWSVEKPKKGDICGLGDVDASTDEDGRVTFNDLPIDCISSVIFGTDPAGYYAPIRATLEPGSEATEITATLSRLLRVHGKVTFGDGSPAVGAMVKAAGDGYVGNRFHGKTRSDERGHFEFEVYHNQFYVFAAVLDHSITPLATRVILDEAPTDEIRLVLQNATRVHGRLTIGPDQRPWAGELLFLNRHGDEEYAKIPTNDRLPILKRRPINPRDSSATVTDEQGTFEFLGGPGTYHIGASAGVPPATFVLTDEAEFEINLRAERPSHEKFTGRVILRDEPRQGVAEACVTGSALINEGGPGMLATSDAQGSFRATRRTVAMLVYARTEDGSLAGIVRVGPDDRSADIAVGPTASAHGRLIDPTTGGPLGNMEVTYGVSWDGPHIGTECGGSVRSDDRGEFTADGLVPGWQYRFVAIREMIPSDSLATGHWFHLAKMTPDGAERIDLGDFKVDPSGEAKPVSTTARAPMAEPPKIYDTKADGNEQVAAALKTAKAEKKRVLVQFGANSCGWCHKLSDCFKENEKVAASLRENYVVVLVDVMQVNDKKHNADVNERYGNPTRHGLPVLVVLDAEGKLLKTKDTGEFEEDGHHGPKKVLAFLNRWKPE